MHTWSSCVPVGRYCICSLYHRPCKHNGAVALKAGEMISNSSIDGPVFTYAISQVFDVINGNWIPIIVLFVWVTCYAFYYRALSKENKLAEAKDGNAKAAGE